MSTTIKTSNRTTAKIAQKTTSTTARGTTPSSTPSSSSASTKSSTKSKSKSKKKSVMPLPSSGSSQESSSSSSTPSVSQYIKQAQKNAIEKIYSSAIDAACMPSCERSDEDYIMNCRQLSFLPFFTEEHNETFAGVEDVGIGVGAYALPRSCEYCNASTTSLCPANCTRPKLFFRKQKPPFQTWEGWDPNTEYELEMGAVSEKNRNKKNQRRTSKNKKKNNKNGEDRGISPTSWMSGLFITSSPIMVTNTQKMKITKNST